MVRERRVKSCVLTASLVAQEFEVRIVILYNDLLDTTNYSNKPSSLVVLVTKQSRNITTF
jgi:hypothetical protein